jgi:hypothetical protein
MSTGTINSQHQSAPPAPAGRANASGRRVIRRPVTDSPILRRWALADLIAAARWRRAFA